MLSAADTQLFQKGFVVHTLCLLLLFPHWEQSFSTQLPISVLINQLGEINVHPSVGSLSPKCICIERKIQNWLTHDITTSYHHQSSKCHLDVLSHVQMDMTRLHTEFTVQPEHLTCDVLREAGRSAQEEEVGEERLQAAARVEPHGGTCSTSREPG